jgi:endonuclease-3
MPASTAAVTPRGAKRPFDIAVAVRRIREAVRPLPKAAMFALAEEGHGTLFEQVVACILSIRTRDEVSLVAARRLFARAAGPAEIAGLSGAAIDRLIGDTSFHAAKAGQTREIARRTAREHSGVLPCDAMCCQVGVERHR